MPDFFNKTWEFLTTHWETSTFATLVIAFFAWRTFVLTRKYYKQKILKEEKQETKQNKSIELPFNPLKTGYTDELVGRKKVLAFLKENLINKKNASVAIVSVQGGGGMGKTFISHVFKEMNQSICLLEIAFGEKSALDAGIDFLRKFKIDTQKITKQNIKEKIEEHLLSYQDGGILFFDDVTKHDIKIIIPNLANWHVLITSRNLDLVKNLNAKIYELQPFKLDISLNLFKKILKGKFKEKHLNDYEILSNFLANRPYSIRLAAESIKQSLLINTPRKLLEKLKSKDYDNDKNMDNLYKMLFHSLEQLKKKSEFSYELLLKLSVASDQGIEIKYFLDWQKDKASQSKLEKELKKAQNLGLLLVEEIELNSNEKKEVETKIRLHTDLLMVLKDFDTSKTRKSFQKYLHNKVVISNKHFNEKQALQTQIIFLCSKYKNNKNVLYKLYNNFWEHLYNTGQLNSVYNMVKILILMFDKDKSKLSIYYSNQALILDDWGKVDEAMELHKKQKKLCKELGDKKGLAACYGNQALILQRWGKLDKAMDFLKKQEKLCKELGDKAGLSRSYSGQALILKNWGQLDEAMELYKKQKKLCKELGDKAGLSRSYSGQGLILKDWGKLDDAMELFKKEENLCKELGDKKGLSRTYGNQALILSDWGKLDDAMVLNKKEEKLCKELGDKAGLATCYWNMGELLKELKQHKSAIKKFEMSIKLEKQLKHPDYEKDLKFLNDYKKEIKAKT